MSAGTQPGQLGHADREQGGAGWSIPVVVVCRRAEALVKPHSVSVNVRGISLLLQIRTNGAAGQR